MVIIYTQTAWRHYNVVQKLLSDIVKHHLYLIYHLKIEHYIVKALIIVFL